MNAQGRVQRFQQGLRPPESARPAWLVLGALVAALRGEETPGSAPEAFARMADAHPAFEGLTWEAVGDGGTPLVAEAVHG